MTTKKSDAEAKPAANEKAGPMEYERIRIPSRLQQEQAAAQEGAQAGHKAAPTPE